MQIRDPLADILSLYPAFLTASAESWDSSQQSFMDLSGNGRVGTLQAGAVSVGSVSGNGATWPVPYVGGTTETQISWGAASIPSTFTICSITRYSGAAKQRILQCRDMNWLHGHYGYAASHANLGNAGATYYDDTVEAESAGDIYYTISPNTNWVVACGRNIQTAGSAGTIINGVVTSTAEGGAGSCELYINQGPRFYDASDWQLSKVYVWNTHLPDAVFADASARLNSYLADSAPAEALLLSSSTCARFLALVLGSPPRFASVSSRGSSPLGSAVLPVYSASGGPQGKGYVTFDRAQSQYVDAGARTLNIATNGGLTIVAVVRFTGTPGEYERIIDLHMSGLAETLIMVYRSATSSNVGFEIKNRGSVTSSSGEIVQNVWLTVVARYRASTMEYRLTVNDNVFTGIGSAAATDRTASNTWIARSFGDQQPYFNGDMAGVFVVDEYLSTVATSAIADAMVRGEDLTTQGPCAPQVISPLLPVVLSSADLYPSLSLARFVSWLPLQ
jgi:hypothetical protein